MDTAEDPMWRHRAARSWQVVIPTRDSASWIGPVLDRYAVLGLRPIILLDSASRDATERIVRRRGLPVHSVAPAAPRVEATVGAIAAIVGDGWVLRLDDDEVPSAALLHWLDAELPDRRIASIGIHRRWAYGGPWGRSARTDNGASCIHEHHSHSRLRDGFCA